MKRELLIIGFLSLAFCGCVSKSAMMIGPGGKVVRCDAQGWESIGAPLATKTFGQCMEDAARMGFLIVEEAGYLGITLEDQQVNGENVIAKVSAGSPAAKAGIAQGDVVVAVKGQKPAGVDDFYVMVFGRKNDPVEITVRQKGQVRTYVLIRAPREDQTIIRMDKG
jgi:predicted metalloprotease with PDZ domain